MGDPWTHDQDDIIGNEREEKHFQIVIAIVKVSPQIPQSYPSRMLVNQLSLYWSDCDDLILHDLLIQLLLYTLGFILAHPRAL